MSLSRRTMLTGMLATGLGLTACSSDPTVHASGDADAGGADPAASTPRTTTPAFPTIDRTIATGLAVPWSLAFLADGAALVSERESGRVLRVDGGGSVDEVGVVPGVVAQGEGGLLGLALSPDESALYAYLSSEDDNRLVRIPFDGGLGTPEVLVDGIALARNHQGGRLRFGPDGMLSVTVGDAAEGSRAQDPADLAGKILRVDLDGRAAEGNPFGTRVWSLGHRNPQSLAWDGDRMWAAEFGQHQADELNRIEPGANYGRGRTTTASCACSSDAAGADAADARGRKRTHAHEGARSSRRARRTTATTTKPAALVSRPSTASDVTTKSPGSAAQAAGTSSFRHVRHG